MAALAEPKPKETPGAVKPETAAPLDKPAKAEPLGEGAMAFIATSLGNTGRKKKETPAPNRNGKPADADEDKNDDPKPVPTPAKPAPKPRAQPQAIDEEKLGEAVGRSVVKAMGERDKPVAPKEPEYPPEVQSKLVMYERLAKQFPEKYKDHAKKFLANAQKFTAYSEKWERDHPGQEFDDTAEEHEAFRSTLEAETEYDEDDHATALVRETVAEEKKKWREEVDQEIKPLKERVKLADAEKDLKKAQTDSTSQFWDDMAEEFPGVIDDKKAFNDAALREAHEKDPASTSMAFRAASDAAFYARELHLLDHSLTEFLGEEVITERTPPETVARIHAHRFLNRRLAIEEEKAASKERLDDQGRPFVTRAEYNKLTTEKQAKVWTLTTEDCRFLLTRHIAHEIRKAMQKSSTAKPGEGVSKDGQSLPPKSQRQAVKPLEDEEELDEKPISPSTPTAPRLASSRGKSASTPSEPLGGFVLRSIRGR